MASSGRDPDARGDPVRFLPTCLLDTFRPQAAVAAARVLEEAGCAVQADPAVVCCGQPAFNMGDVREAQRVAEHLIDSWDDAESPCPIVVPSGSCASMMNRHYPDLFAGTERAAAAGRIAARTQEWSAFLRRRGFLPKQGPDPPARARASVVMHPSCHALRELGIQAQPEELLEAAGHRLAALPEAETCCGFGGAFAVKQPETSAAMLRQKLDAIEDARAEGATTLGCLDMGCLLHIEGGWEKQPDARNRPMHMCHVAELIAPRGAPEADI